MTAALKLRTDRYVKRSDSAPRTTAVDETPAKPTLREKLVGNWKEVPGTEGRYLVSSLGTVKTKAGLLRKTSADTFPSVILTFADGSTHSRCVVDIVAAAFLGKCPRGYKAVNRNWNSKDNRAANVAYVPVEEAEQFFGRRTGPKAPLAMLQSVRLRIAELASVPLESLAEVCDSLHRIYEAAENALHFAH